ncbi:hypothetical protein B1J93_00900 [Leptospira kirschneri serovar Pomona]|uniref:Uncharacterized protein n=1 Tax=Leptospira kirschneri serovar Pomona TaxID=561005 RepID=A0A1T1E3G4_9LEPT|nr:hypothetical protein B1J93_00900 [Leptospira kirschneri serovar Pomona]
MLRNYKSFQYNGFCGNYHFLLRIQKRLILKFWDRPFIIYENHFLDNVLKSNLYASKNVRVPTK